jgi:hypothetical protein
MEEHQGDSRSLATLRECLSALEAGDAKRAAAANHRLPTGRMGCFDDWFPPVVFPHETPDYVGGVFEALVTNWKVLMRLLDESN